MNGQFKELAEQFLVIFSDEGGEDWEEEELDQRIGAFLEDKGIDEAWMDEACDVIHDAIKALWD